MRVLFVDGPADGRIMEMENRAAHVVVPVINRDGFEQVMYERHEVKAGKRSVHILLPQGAGDKELFGALLKITEGYCELRAREAREREGY